MNSARPSIFFFSTLSDFDLGNVTIFYILTLDDSLTKIHERMLGYKVTIYGLSKKMTIDFKKLMGKKKLSRPVDPIEIFNTSDHETGKETLRKPQESVLKEWNEKYREKRDIIVKLHTGQGKTLIGLLMLQSSINQGLGPCLYLCPNTYLVKQTCDDALSFGIETVQFDPSLSKVPQSFLNSQAILVTTCNKLFNGKSVFGVAGSGKEPLNVGAIVMDDAHKCLDIIKDAFSLTISRKDGNNNDNPIYLALWKLFQETLTWQAPGTCSDIFAGEENSLLAVPFWAWENKLRDVISILQENKENLEILFSWDLIKDKIEHSICIFSGARIEITPRMVPIDLIPSFAQAKRRIFLSATLTEDAFLVKDLDIDPESIAHPLTSGDVKYSGERLIVMPSNIDAGISRETLIRWVSDLANKNGNFGVVAITPSFGHAKSWEKYGATTSSVKTLEQKIIELNNAIANKNARQVLILVNEYDGVDLPDATCRILALDSLPRYNTLIDKYTQEMRPTSAIIRRHLAQRVEQGMGRAIRGTGDWCVVLAFGTNLTDFLSEDSKKKFLSKEAQLQIRIGEGLAKELKKIGTGLKVIEGLVNQVLDRDAGWKEYYRESMCELELDNSGTDYLKRALLEKEAENYYLLRDYEKSVAALDQLILVADIADKGWYLQLMATYMYSTDRAKSMGLQLKARMANNRLFRPPEGLKHTRLTSTGTSRTGRIFEWVKQYESYNSMLISLTNILDKTVFTAAFETFEEGIDDLGKAIGFGTQRPDHDTRNGPDNLWNIEGKKYWIIECKNMVSIERKEIAKKESSQLIDAIGWFRENYGDCEGTPIFLHPADTFAKEAHPTEQCWLLGQDKLEELKTNIMKFYTALQDTPKDELTDIKIRDKLKDFNLSTSQLDSYLVKVEKRHFAK